MEEKLFISDEAIKKFGLLYFENDKVEDYSSLADNDIIELEDGVLLSKDDMYNIYLSANEDDCSFNDVEDLYPKMRLLKKCSYFNMKEICSIASVPYQSFRNWKSNDYIGLSNHKIEALLRVMSNIMED